ncbi:ABC transporter permease [Propionicicella superfundia]|uniref:ABC transporter permease n=1 Tax=Propionicicella superfundia TaxID=348582 RepID=UPI0003FBC897|nr:ABC transporter permease [Propionicicella superfundia]
MNLFGYLGDAANWAGPGGIWERIGEHMGYVAVSLLVAMIIGIPVGAAVGHYRRGQVLVVQTSNAARSIPTLGLLVLVVTLMGTGLVPVVLALTVLAVPPVLNAAAVGFRDCDPDAVHAARALGMTPWQVVTGVELPLALPLVVSGVRSAALQLIATATVAAMAASGGLGRLIVDGQLLGPSGYPEMFAGAVIVGVLAIAVDLLLGAIGWILRMVTYRRGRLTLTTERQVAV